MISGHSFWLTFPKKEIPTVGIKFVTDEVQVQAAGSPRIFEWGWGGTMTSKLPILKILFLLGFRALHFVDRLHSAQFLGKDSREKRKTRNFRGIAPLVLKSAGFGTPPPPVGEAP